MSETKNMPEWTEEYRTADRSNWRTGGAWENEPDKVVWVDEATGLDCLAVRNPLGAWCGYVGVTEAHPWHGIDDGQCPTKCEDTWCEHTPESRVDVHGGITFADACHENAEDHTRAVCHLASDGRPVWWFGFDTVHLGDLYPADRMLPLSVDMRNGLFGLPADNGFYRTLPYVVEQVQGLARQLAEESA